MRKAAVAPSVAPTRLKAGPPQRTEERTAGKAEECAGDEQQRPEGEERDMGEWRPRPEIAHRCLKQRRIEARPIGEEPQRRARKGEPEQDARDGSAHGHAAGSRRPSG